MEEGLKRGWGGGVAFLSASLLSCPGTTLVWGWAEGPEAPLISKREGRAMTNEFAAIGLDLAFQS